MRGLLAYVYRQNDESGWSRSNSRNLIKGGMVVIVGLGKDSEVHEPRPDAPAVRLVKRRVCGQDVVHLEPVDQPEGMVGPMFGGTYVATSDGRFGNATGFYGAVALHDMFQTAPDYAASSID